MKFLVLIFSLVHLISQLTCVAWSTEKGASEYLNKNIFLIGKSQEDYGEEELNESQTNPDGDSQLSRMRRFSEISRIYSSPEDCDDCDRNMLSLLGDLLRVADSPEMVSVLFHRINAILDKYKDKVLSRRGRLELNQIVAQMREKQSKSLDFRVKFDAKLVNLALKYLGKTPIAERQLWLKIISGILKKYGSSKGTGYLSEVYLRNILKDLVSSLYPDEVMTLITENPFLLEISDEPKSDRPTSLDHENGPLFYASQESVLEPSAGAHNSKPWHFQTEDWFTRMKDPHLRQRPELHSSPPGFSTSAEIPILIKYINYMASLIPSMPSRERSFLVDPLSKSFDKLPNLSTVSDSDQELLRKALMKLLPYLAKDDIDRLLKKHPILGSAIKIPELSNSNLHSSPSWITDVSEDPSSLSDSEKFSFMVKVCDELGYLCDLMYSNDHNPKAFDRAVRKFLQFSRPGDIEGLSRRHPSLAKILEKFTKKPELGFKDRLFELGKSHPNSRKVLDSPAGGVPDDMNVDPSRKSTFPVNSRETTKSWTDYLDPRSVFSIFNRFWPEDKVRHWVDRKRPSSNLDSYYDKDEPSSFTRILSRKQLRFYSDGPLHSTEEPEEKDYNLPRRANHFHHMHPLSESLLPWFHNFSYPSFNFGPPFNRPNVPKGHSYQPRISGSYRDIPLGILDGTLHPQGFRSLYFPSPTSDDSNSPKISVPKGHAYQPRNNGSYRDIPLGILDGTLHPQGFRSLYFPSPTSDGSNSPKISVPKGHTYQPRNNGSYRDIPLGILDGTLHPQGFRSLSFPLPTSDHSYSPKISVSSDDSPDSQIPDRFLPDRVRSILNRLLGKLNSVPSYQKPFHLEPLEDFLKSYVNSWPQEDKRLLMPLVQLLSQNLPPVDLKRVINTVPKLKAAYPSLYSGFMSVNPSETLFEEDQKKIEFLNQQLANARNIHDSIRIVNQIWPVLSRYVQKVSNNNDQNVILTVLGSIHEVIRSLDNKQVALILRGMESILNVLLPGVGELYNFMNGNGDILTSPGLEMHNFAPLENSEQPLPNSLNSGEILSKRWFIPRTGAILPALLNDEGSSEAPYEDPEETEDEMNGSGSRFSTFQDERNEKTSGNLFSNSDYVSEEPPTGQNPEARQPDNSNGNSGSLSKFGESQLEFNEETLGS